MDFSLGTSADALRGRLRALMAEELPDGFRGPFVDDEAHEVAQRFCRRLAEEGLLTAHWPAEYGGSEASAWEQAVLREEMWANHEPRGAQYMNASWVGPTIMHFGTEQQKQQHLPPIAEGRVIWCQGFSEPEAGSDLASLRLRARSVPDGGWILDGQKIWTSYADLAQWCFLAARTSTTGRRHDGITIFLVPMDREGITVRPIDTLMGRHHLNEVFFEGAAVGTDDVLGAVDHGWEVILAVLSLERVGIPRYARSDRMLCDVTPELSERRREDAAEARGLELWHARALARCRVARLLNYRALAMQEGGQLPATEASVARLASTLLDQEVAELAMQILGESGLSSSSDGPLGGTVEDAWRYARTSTVAAGTTEIQRLIVARGVVGAGW